MSLLGHLVPGWHPERAATIALAHILDLDASPGMASAFVDLVRETGSLNFEPERVASDPDQKDDSRPDVTIYDAAGKPRVFVEAAFWEGVPAAQPVEYLRKLPADLPSGLVYIAPRKRIRSLWDILHGRCAGNLEIEVRNEPATNEAVWARVGPCVLLVASWAYVLETLQRVTEDSAVEQDIVQLRGLAKRMETAAFLPLEEDEAADAALARRLLCYRDLVHKIARRLEKDQLVTDLKYSQPSFRKQRDEGYAVRLHGKFELRFGIELGAWRDSGITPLWCVLKGSESFSTLGNWLRIKQRFDGVRSYGDLLYVPVRLKTGVDEAAVIDDAVDRMRGIADVLLDVFENRPPSRPAPTARRSVLAEVIPKVMQREPAATQALHYILEASTDLARTFVDLLEGGRFEIGRIGSEWLYAKGVRPDLAIHDTGEVLRMFVENKFDAELTPGQPVDYLKELRQHPASVLAFIAPEDQIESRWKELKEKCDAAGLVFKQESRTADRLQIQVAERTMLIISWRRVLDALQETAAARGLSAIEQEIVQLRSLARVNPDAE
jgi:hypothetical protein